MPEFLTGWPFALVFAFLFSGAMLRGQGIYWLGRLATVQALRHTHPTEGWRLRTHRALSGQGAQRGVELVRRWGLVAVPVAYLTVGVQSMVMAGAGILQVPWPRFTLAQVPGALAWAAIYSTVGFAVWTAALAAAAGSPAGIAVIVALAAAVVGAVVVHRRRRRPTTPAER
ncbi:membrane protein DedA, SNARE-associated domain [Georgenia satyanarayanai]|uniref:Membrane protein DedA, SNARE-associated domain n=1 Tax=Georgenia satyanarayanai TaxID=860221 RepID=A0A2Y8ZVV7_9MICO|nr:VTT domain-containing protein [Georgenia satyanarayanai]PYG01651.1 membrane protein DedA with SNARE-associated domain [Georgenia satyanarayanai]SSA36451.1 membrane protein DedA, SNARE-associated domain [Georgenia satyanarayanai]